MKRSILLLIFVIFICALSSCDSPADTLLPTSEPSTPTVTDATENPNDTGLPPSIEPSFTPEPSPVLTPTPCTHSFEERIIKPSSCSQTGTICYVCTLCSEEYREEIPLLPHDFAPATCIMAKSCKNCSFKEGDALWHDFTLIGSKPATCTEKGSNFYSCSRCEEKYTEELELKAHSYLSATCILPKTCKICGSKSGTALGHNYKDGKCTRCESTVYVPVLAPPSYKGYFGDKFADKFASEGEVISTDTVYKSHDISITFETNTTQFTKGYDVVYYVFDIYIRNIENFYTSSTKNTTRQYLEKVEKYALGITDENGDPLYSTTSVLSMNGDLWRFNKAPSVVRNGVLYNYKTSIKNDIGVLYYDGSFEVISPDKYDFQKIAEKSPYQIWHFGPGLLDGNGNVRGSSSSAYKYDGASYNGIIGGRNPRAALGYFEPGHYCFVVIDGRCSFSYGATIPNLARLMSDLGCMQAYNLDGGNTSQIKFNGSYARKSDEDQEQRKLDDILCIGELAK